MWELFALWSEWLSGPIQRTPEPELWGHPLWLWARWSTVAQVLALITLALEVVGQERLWNASERIRTWPKLQDLIRRRERVMAPYTEGAQRPWGVVLGYMVASVVLTAALLLVPLLLWDHVTGFTRFIAEVWTDGWSDLDAFDAAGFVVALIFLAFFAGIFLSALVQLSILYASAVLALIIGLLAGRRTRTWLNIVIVVATAVNLHSPCC